MADVATTETFKWATNDPKIIKASTVICRFMDDVAEHKFNQKREDDFSSIKCYMEKYEFLKPTEMPVPVLSRSLNFARAMDVLFKDGDGYTHVGEVTKNGITSVLINPVPL
ncbi:hypothetical protein DITRI_Ditri01bG0166400 [Diplodiscus trichospermus]